MNHSDPVIARRFATIADLIRDPDATAAETAQCVAEQMLAIVDHLDDQDYPVPVLRQILTLERIAHQQFRARARHQIQSDVANFRDLVRDLLALLPTTPCH